MFHLAPVGLPTKINANSAPNSTVEKNVTLAINDIKESSFKQKIIYNLSHPDTKELIKSLDIFFSQGYVFSVIIVKTIKSALNKNK